MRPFIHEVMRLLHTGGFLVDRMSIVDQDDADHRATVATFTVSNRHHIYRVIVTNEAAK